MIKGAIAALALFWASGAEASPCEDVVFSEASFTVCTAHIQTDDLRLFLNDKTGEPYGGFLAIEKDVGALSFAMNAGMFHADQSPVGLYQEDGEVLKNIILSSGPGNFGMLPNGVFCIARNRFDVLESTTYQAALCEAATQSGPMLVIDGALHPRFLPGGTSKFIRNGVGTTEDGKSAHFVISNQPVNFHTFARFFRDYLELDQALYFDGNVSRLFAPEHGRSDFGRELGPIVGVLKP